VLHQALSDRASELGVRFLWGRRVTDISAHGVSLDGDEITADWVIGADGLKSRVREWAWLNKKRRESVRFGFRRHYRIPPWTDHVEVYWGPRCQMYVTPVSEDEVAVALLAAHARIRFDLALPYFPELQERLSGCGVVSAERGALTASRNFVDVFRGSIALVGDASGSVDAITGEGLGLSFRQAIRLAEAMVQGDLELYAAAHTRLMRRPAWMSRLLLALDRYPALRSKIFRTFAQKPWIFATLLAVHIGEFGPADRVSSPVTASTTTHV
jgi:flavin-dependent dehydrogenase